MFDPKEFPPPFHVDDRGYFQELLKISSCDILKDIEQVSHFTIQPGKKRGGHYHKETYEVFVLLSGECYVRLEHTIGIEGKGFYLDTPGQSYVVIPDMVHSFESSSGCHFLVLSTKEFDPEDTDTYVMEQNEG